MADARRLRTLWVESVRVVPNLPEDRRLGIVSKEFIKRAPAGGFMYLSSFHTTQPSINWIRSALLGRLSKEVLGEPLIRVSESNRGTGWVARVSELERRVEHIMTELDIQLPVGG
jgi:hypothetical protein